jgi:hypothetical protein
MATDCSDSSLAYTLPFQLTQKIHRQILGSLQPERLENSAHGNIIVIIGAGAGIGAVSLYPPSPTRLHEPLMVSEQVSATIWVRAGAAGVVVVG